MELNIVNIEDVDKLYEQLLPWDKKDFVEKHLIDSGCETELDEDVYHFNDIWDFVRDHDEDDILEEIGSESCFAYVRDEWSLYDFIEALKDRGRSWSTGYSDEEIVNDLDLTKLSKDAQVNILKQLDRSVIENFLKNNTENNG
jgi:hypothetical protein